MKVAPLVMDEGSSSHHVTEDGETNSVLAFLRFLVSRSLVGGSRCDTSEWSSDSLAGIVTGHERRVVYTVATCCDETARVGCSRSSRCDLDRGLPMCCA